MQLLCLLASNPANVVSRDTLIQALWPQVIVNENSLTRAVSELRKQLQDPTGKQGPFIDTIPKRGYRLLLAPQFSEEPRPARSWPGLQIFSALHGGWTAAAGFATLALSLLLAVSSASTPVSESFPKAQLLADEIISTNPAFEGGTLTLSTASNTKSLSDTIETPVIASDGNRFAYIQYDHTGSTIYLGALDAAIAPTAVYNSSDRLFNLAWSPVGNSLLFAHQAGMTTAALLSPSPRPELLSLNLDSFEARKLIEADTPTETKPATELNLT